MERQEERQEEQLDVRPNGCPKNPECIIFHELSKPENNADRIQKLKSICDLCILDTEIDRALESKRQRIFITPQIELGTPKE